MSRPRSTIDYVSPENVTDKPGEIRALRTRLVLLRSTLTVLRVNLRNGGARKLAETIAEIDDALRVDDELLALTDASPAKSPKNEKGTRS